MKQIKLFIFDMDGTLYYLGDLIRSGFDTSVSFLKEYLGMTKAEAISFLNENHIYPYLSKEAKSTTQLFNTKGYDIDKWNEYRSQHFPYEDINIDNAIKEATLLSFKQIAPIVLLTNNTPTNIQKVLKQIHINQDIFEKIVINEQTDGHSSKRYAMEKLVQEYNLETDNVLSIGDRYDVDALPMLEIGGKALIIEHPLYLKEIINDWPNLKTNEKYAYYEAYSSNNQ